MVYTNRNSGLYLNFLDVIRSLTGIDLSSSLLHLSLVGCPSLALAGLFKIGVSQCNLKTGSIVNNFRSMDWSSHLLRDAILCGWLYKHRCLRLLDRLSP
jgi:hypothetical protein